MTTYEKPIRTGVVSEIGGDMTILGETEKAYLFVRESFYRRGTCKDVIETEQWIPKSVWHNDRNFTEAHDGTKVFNTPYFLR